MFLRTNYQAQQQPGSMGIIGSDSFQTRNTGNSQGGSFFYIGNCQGLQVKLQDMKNKAIPIKDAKINISGNQLKGFDIGCYVFTIFLAAIFIVPAFLFCCQRWKRCVYSVYEVPIDTYQKLGTIFCTHLIRSVKLTVNDNKFDKNKADLIISMISRSPVKRFTFNNVAQPHNFNSHQWQDFKSHMKPVKELAIASEIKLHDKTVF